MAAKTNHVACSSALVLGFLLPEQYTNLITLLLVVGYISMSLYQATFWQSFLSTSAARYLLLGWGCISLLNLTSIGIGPFWLGISNVWHTVIFVLFTIGIILQVLGIELFDRVADCCACTTNVISITLIIFINCLKFC